MIAFRVKLSRLRITEKKAIVLEDFDHKEVKMDTLTKAVFLLYLKHPEGIRYKELSDYQQELEEIYSSITGREDLDSIRNTAMTEYGMSYAKESQIVYYTVNDDDYMNQYSEIPRE